MEMFVFITGWIIGTFLGAAISLMIFTNHDKTIK